jgi:hypothetical protein
MQAGNISKAANLSHPLLSSKAEKSSPRRRGFWPVPPVPARFNFGFTERRPLVPLAAAAMFLNIPARQTLALIESGELLWAFDIRSGGARRREPRILRQSLFEFAGLCSLSIVTSRQQTELRHVVGLILPEEIIVPSENARGWKTERQRRQSRNFQQEMRIDPANYRAVKFPKEPVLRAAEIAEYFSCLPQHVQNLIADGMFQLVNLPLGPKASPFVTRESVIQFLEKRRMS